MKRQHRLGARALLHDDRIRPAARSQRAAGSTRAGSPQPYCGCSISANTGPPRPSAHEHRPEPVRRARACACRSGSVRSSAQRDRHRHEVDREDPSPRRELDQRDRRRAGRSRSRPPSTRSRSRSPRHARDRSNVSMISASVLGTSSAPAIPCTARAAISTLAVRRDRAQQRARAEARSARARTPAGARTGRRASRRPAAASRERQQVRLDDPLLLGEAAVKSGADRRQRDVDDRAVEEHDPRAEDARDQRRPLALDTPRDRTPSSSPVPARTPSSTRSRRSLTLRANGRFGLDDHAVRLRARRRSGTQVR